jgi:hypothetical protein
MDFKTTLVSALLVLTSRAYGCAYQFTTIDVPNNDQTRAEGIDDAGQVVGFYYDTSGGQHGFILSAGVYTTFTVPNSSIGTTDAYGINASGQIATRDKSLSWSRDQLSERFRARIPRRQISRL